MLFRKDHAMINLVLSPHKGKEKIKQSIINKRTTIIINCS